MEYQSATPPALRWVAIFLAACAVLGLWLGFRDQIRRNPPDWYAGRAPVDAPAMATGGGAEIPEASPLAPDTAQPAPAPRPAAPKPAETTTADEAAGVATPGPEPAKPRSPAAPVKPAAASDPVGDILESQKAPEAPATVPY